jgi:hypothetical protein
MKLSPLINNQDVFIDAHGHEKEGISFSDERYDIHLHKKTKYRIEGKVQEVNIRIPLNSNRSVTVTNAQNKDLDVPRKLLKEVRAVFEEDIDLRTNFVKEMKSVLENYYNVFLDKELAKKVLQKISSFFDLSWDDENIFFVILPKKDFPYAMYQTDFISKDTHVRLTMDWKGISIKNIKCKEKISTNHNH